MIWQNSVFDRAEEGGDHAERRKRHHQQRHGLQREAQRREAGREDLGELQAPGEERLVMLVGELAAEPRQQEERRDEDRAGQGDERGGVRSANGEQDQDDQSVLEEIVIERREELAPEERREAPRGHQLADHVPLQVTARNASPVSGAMPSLAVER